MEKEKAGGYEQNGPVAFFPVPPTPRHCRSWLPSTRSSASAALSSRGEGGPPRRAPHHRPLSPSLSLSLSKPHTKPETLARRAPRIAVAMELPEPS